MYVDSHCHLSSPEFAGRLPEIRAAMAEAEVDRALCICTTLDDFERVHALALAYDNFWCSAGGHPDEAESREPSVDDLVALAARPKVVAIGETGLDYFYDHSDRNRQQASFRTHIAAARETGLPIIVHTRDADEDTMAILEAEMGQGAFTGVIHCYSSSRRLEL